MGLLVLERDRGESITIIVPPSATETRLEFSVFKVKPNGAVRLAFDAPRWVTILRSEIVDAKPATEEPSQ